MAIHFPKFKAKSVFPNLSFYLATAIVLSFYLNYSGAVLVQLGQKTQTTPSFQNEMIGTHFGLVLTWVLFLKRKNYWRKFYALLLVLALSPILEFTNYGFSFGILGISIDLIALILLLLHLIYNPILISKVGSFVSGQSDQSNSLNSETIAKLEKKFAEKSEAQLNHISVSREFSREAQVAAKNLLDKKTEK